MPPVLPADLAILSHYLHHTLGAVEGGVHVPTEDGLNPGLLAVLRMLA